jgi:hypothetical protein
VFENRVVRRIFGPERDEVTGDWKKLRNEELHNLYSSPNIITMIKSRNMRWAGHVARMERRGIRVGYWWKRQKEIKMDLREIEWDGMDWIELAQDRDHWRAFVNTVMNLRVP